MRILFTGSSGEIYQTLGAQLRNRPGIEIVACPFSEFSPSLADNDVHLIIVGVERPEDADAVTRLLRDQRLKLPCPAVVLASESSSSHVLEWLRHGAAAVELWPCSASRIAFLIDYLSISRRVAPPKDVIRPTAIQAPSSQLDDIVLASPVMQRLIEQIDRVAPLDSNILFTGETGVGKTRLARLVHDRSRKKDASFVSVNCGAIPDNLLESELFGHRKGAFTGADTDRTGRFEEVGTGTLFLDEVDSIPINSQCKLLRALENRIFEPLGCNRSIKFRGRIIAASNSQLDQLIEQGKFRADLFYRLSVVEMSIPPLRERREEIRPIAEATLRDFAARNELRAESFDEEVLVLLERYSWPGNVRQLRNVVESGAALCEGEKITLADLTGRWLADAYNERENTSSSHATATPNVSTGSRDAGWEIDRSNVELNGFPLAEARARMEADRIKSVLRAVGNNRTKAAIQLGISRTMLYKKIAKYGLANG